MESSWSTQRRLVYGIMTLIVVIGISAGIFFKVFYKTPTCTDGVQNGTELGIDCGGSCTKLCTTDVLTPIVLWVRYFNVSGTVYSAVAFIENPNVHSENKKVTYEFKIFDQDNLLIASRVGETFIPKNKKFAIFEPAIVIPNKNPKRIEFNFLSFSDWQKNTTLEPEIALSYSPLRATTTAPRIDGVVTNKSLIDVASVELVGIVFDGKENAVAVSRTFIDTLTKGTNQPFVFTWPKPFDLGVTECKNPLDTVFVFDTNGIGTTSPLLENQFATIKDRTIDFVRNIEKKDRVAIVSFDTNGFQKTELVGSQDSIVASIQNLSISTSSPVATSTLAYFNTGLGGALDMLSQTQSTTISKKVIVLFSNSTTTPKNTLVPTNLASTTSIFTAIKDASIPVYSFSFGTTTLVDTLKKTKGTDFITFVSSLDTKQLNNLYTTISADVCAKTPNVITVIHRLPYTK